MTFSPDAAYYNSPGAAYYKSVFAPSAGNTKSDDWSRHIQSKTPSPSDINGRATEINNLETGHGNNESLQQVSAVLPATIDTQEKLVVEILFDTGASHRNYISRRVRRKLRDVESFKVERQVIMTTASATQKVTESVRIPIKLEVHNIVKYVECDVIECQQDIIIGFITIIAKYSQIMINHIQTLARKAKNIIAQPFKPALLATLQPTIDEPGQVTEGQSYYPWLEPEELIPEETAVTDAPVFPDDIDLSEEAYLKRCAEFEKGVEDTLPL